MVFIYRLVEPPSLSKNAFVARIWPDSSKNILLGRTLQDNAIFVIFLRIDAFLARSFHAIYFLHDSFRRYISRKIFTRILQDIFSLQEFCKKSIFCKNNTRACNNIAFAGKIWQKSCKISRESWTKCIFFKLGH